MGASSSVKKREGGMEERKEGRKEGRNRRGREGGKV